MNDAELILRHANPAERKRLVGLMEAGLPLWKPYPGPQTQALYSKADWLFYGGSAGGGKLMDISTPIPTPKGFCELASLHPGDVVLGRDGLPCTILAESEVVRASAYLLRFDDGSEIIANDDHRWLTFDAFELNQLTRLDDTWRAKRRERRESRVAWNKSGLFSSGIISRNKLKRHSVKSAPCGTIRTTSEIVATLKTARGRTNHAIPVAEPLELPDVDFLLDPYVLGVWLGDGSSSGGIITSADQEIVDNVVSLGFPVTSVSKKVNNKASNFYHKNLVTYLKLAGVFDNKHIPRTYLWASKGQRLALLQGLMDTDGGVEGNSVSFTNTRKCLTEGVAHLARSLGHKVSVRESRAKLNGRDMGPKWTVKFTPKLNVFRLSTKANKLKLATRRTTNFRYIVSAERIDPMDMKCICVSASDGLFLASENLIPTHNSDYILGLAIQFHHRSWIFRREYPQLDELVTRSQEIIGNKARFNGAKYTWTFPNGKIIHFSACQHERDLPKFKGRAGDLKAFDEVSDFTSKQFMFLTAWNRTHIPGQRCRVVGAGNPPTHADGEWVIEFWAPWIDPQHPRPAEPGELRWYAMVDRKWVEREDSRKFRYKKDIITPISRTFIPARVQDNPTLMKTGYITTLQNTPEPLRSQLLYGDFNAARGDAPWQLIPTAWVRAAMDRWKERERPDEACDVIGFDPAYGGEDEMVLAPRHGNYIDTLIAYPGREVDDGPKGAAKAIANYRDDATFNIDIIGYGSSVADILAMQGYPIQRINFAARAEDEQGQRLEDESGKLKFGNIRAYLYWALRTALDPNGDTKLCLPPDNGILADLCTPKWKLKINGIYVEDKSEIKKRRGRSIDRGDAIALTMMAPVLRGMGSVVGGASVSGWGYDEGDLGSNLSTNERM